MELMENWQTIVKEKEYNDRLIEWNKKINLVSRKRTNILDLIEESKLFFDAIEFKERVNILDLGTGGGLPGIVIAIHHPETNLMLIDSIQKKVNVVNDIIKKIGLTNAKTICTRTEELAKIAEHKNKYDYVVARSVAVLQDLCKWSKDLIKPQGKLITIKGGNIKGELIASKKLTYINEIKVKEIKDKAIITVNF